MPDSVLKEALGLGRSVIEGVRIEGGPAIVSARPRRRAPRCPVCGRRCDGYDRLATRRWRAMSRARGSSTHPPRLLGTGATLPAGASRAARPAPPASSLPSPDPLLPPRLGLGTSGTASPPAMSSSVSPAPYGHVPSAPTAAHMPGSPIVAAGSAWRPPSARPARRASGCRRERPLPQRPRPRAAHLSAPPPSRPSLRECRAGTSRPPARRGNAPTGELRCGCVGPHGKPQAPC